MRLTLSSICIIFFIKIIQPIGDTMEVLSITSGHSFKVFDVIHETTNYTTVRYIIKPTRLMRARFNKLTALGTVDKYLMLITD